MQMESSTPDWIIQTAGRLERFMPDRHDVGRNFPSFLPL